jgi:hypothetical protein
MDTGVERGRNWMAEAKDRVGGVGGIRYLSEGSNGSEGFMRAKELPGRSARYRNPRFALL